jgi:hypothetical protein
MDIYQKALKQLKPLKLMETAIKDIAKKSQNSPELAPLHYNFVCEMIKVLNELKKDMGESMEGQS